MEQKKIRTLSRVSDNVSHVILINQTTFIDPLQSQLYARENVHGKAVEMISMAKFFPIVSRNAT